MAQLRCVTMHKIEPESAAAKKNNGALLDVRSASTLIGCSEASLRARILRGTVPFRKLGGRVFFLRSELTEFFFKLEGNSVDQALHNCEGRS